MYILERVYIVLAERQMSSGPVGALVGQWPDVGEARRSGEFRCSQRAAATSLDFRIADVCNSPVLADRSY
jgi:hypothetical protein